MRDDSGVRGVYKRVRDGVTYWAYRFTEGGKSYSKTLDVKATKKNLGGAKRAMDDHRLRVRAGAAEKERPAAVAPVLFTEAAEQFLEWSALRHRKHPATTKRQAVSLGAAIKAFGGEALPAITAGDIERFKSIRFRSGLKDITVRKDLLTISQVFDFAMKHRWVTANPVKEVEIPSDKDSINERTITEAEEGLYFSQARLTSSVLHDVGRLMLWQGLRPDEALRLTRDDVDLKGETLLVRHGKSRAARRTLWLQASTIEILRPRITRRFVHLFPGGRWEPEDRPFSYSGMVNIHNRVFETLNGAKDEHHLLDGFDLYSLRHTFATRFYQATKDLDKLARILGHANLATVRRYVNPSQQDIRDAMKEFEKASTCKPRAASRPRKPFLHQRPTPDDAL